MLFNIYYINTFKMYEIKMMINNRMKVTEQEEKQQKDEEGLEAEIEAGVKMPSIFNLKSRAKAQNITNDTTLFKTNLSPIINILFTSQYKASPNGATNDIETDIIGIIQDIILFD